MSKVAIVDFDKTLCNSKWPNMGPPMDGAKEALEEMKKMGWTINVCSCRTSVEVYPYPIDRLEQTRKMADWMKENNMPFDNILNVDKPLGDAYIDDCGHGFRGDWKKVVDEVKQIHGG